jgi:hypothetical protein
MRLHKVSNFTSGCVSKFSIFKITSILFNTRFAHYCVTDLFGSYQRLIYALGWVCLQDLHISSEFAREAYFILLVFLPIVSTLEECDLWATCQKSL